jgi:hypothetical protein
MSAIFEQLFAIDFREPEVGIHFFEVSKCERHVDWRVRHWVTLAGKFHLG